MRKIIAFALALAMMTALPLGVLGQEDSAGQSPEAIVEPWYYYPEPSGFNYSDGMANGTYVDFNVDEATGAISDYTVTMINYNYYYPMIYYEEAPGREGYGYVAPPPEPTINTMRLFDSVKVNGFVPNGHPAVFGTSFYFLGENVLMNFYDYDYSGGSYQFGEENSSVTIKVADGFTINETPYYWYLYAEDDSTTSDWKEWEQGNRLNETTETYGGGEIATNDATGMAYDPYMWTWDEVWLRDNNNTVCSIYVSQGDIEIDNATGTLTISTYADAYLSFSAWQEMPYYECYPEPLLADFDIEERGIIETAVEEGLLAATGYLFSGEGGTQYTDSDTYNDPTFQLEFKEINEDDITIEVGSEIQEGRIVSFNLNKGALNASSESDLRVLLDGMNIKRCDSIEELTEMQGGTKGGYYVVFGQAQNTIFVYVPHFSTHTISIQSLVGQLPGLLVPGLLAGILIAGAIVLVLMKGRKGQDEF